MVRVNLGSHGSRALPLLQMELQYEVLFALAIYYILKTQERLSYVERISARYDCLSLTCASYSIYLDKNQYD